MTQSIALRSHVGADGLLHLSIPTQLIETDLDITVLIRPVAEEHCQTETFSKWWSKQLAKFPGATTQVTERDLRYEYLAEHYQP